MDWEEIITKNQTDILNNHQEKAKKSGNLPDWQKNFKAYVKTKNIIHLWQYFDILGWWRNYGKVAFPNIAMAAAVTLARPYTNASQERDFSMATWFDGKLCQSQKPEILERRLLLGLNREVVDVIKSEISIMKNSSEFSLFGEEKPVMTETDDFAENDMDDHSVDTVRDLVVNHDFLEPDEATDE
jgi:hypothetical protein